MKNVMILLFGMGLASGWWSFGVYFFHYGTPPCDAGGLGLGVGLLILASLITAGYVLFKIASCIYSCWDD